MIEWLSEWLTTCIVFSKTQVRENQCGVAVYCFLVIKFENPHFWARVAPNACSNMNCGGQVLQSASKAMHKQRFWRPGVPKWLQKLHSKIVFDGQRLQKASVPEPSSDSAFECTSDFVRHCNVFEAFKLERSMQSCQAIQTPKENYWIDISCKKHTSRETNMELFIIDTRFVKFVISVISNEI